MLGYDGALVQTGGAHLKYISILRSWLKSRYEWLLACTRARSHLNAYLFFRYVLQGGARGGWKGQEKGALRQVVRHGHD